MAVPLLTKKIVKKRVKKFKRPQSDRKVSVKVFLLLLLLPLPFYISSSSRLIFFI